MRFKITGEHFGKAIATHAGTQGDHRGTTSSSTEPIWSKAGFKASAVRRSRTPWVAADMATALQTKHSLWRMSKIVHHMVMSQTLHT